MGSPWTAVNEDSLIPFVYGNALTAILRASYREGDVDGCLGILPNMRCREIRRVCNGEYRIEGNDVDGFRFVYDGPWQGSATALARRQLTGDLRPILSDISVAKELARLCEEAWG